MNTTINIPTAPDGVLVTLLHACRRAADYFDAAESPQWRREAADRTANENRAREIRAELFKRGIRA